jgi:hypothetical protein
MYLTETKSKPGEKEYRCVLLRESYRRGGQVKNRTIANLSHCKDNEIAAIRLALAHKDDLSVLGSLSQDVRLCEGPSIGAVWTVYAVARRLGLEKVLGTDRAGRLAMWQVLARVIDQGSRLSAVRLAQLHAACDTLGLDRGFDENDLYANLRYLAEQQEVIEQRLFRARRGTSKPRLFLYDVTSTYLEGTENELADWGFNRDKKKGKKQIVIGLLCDEAGEPVSVEVFRGNTQDPHTFGAQVGKVAARFGCEHVTFVGDRGMIKSGQIEDLSRAGFHYITAITKPQIDKLLGDGVLQMDLFDETVCEVDSEGVRFILRRNPQRVADLAATRRDKQACVARLVADKNTYLAEHPRAWVSTACKDVRARIKRLRIEAWLRVEARGRVLRLRVDEAAQTAAARLDGCYVIKTDLPADAVDKQTVHDRYTDLAEVERAFRTCKTAHLEVRPVYVRTSESTRGHVLVVMLAYLIVRELRRAWVSLDVTVEEGLGQLATLTTMEMTVARHKTRVHKIPTPRPASARLLEAADIRLPEALPNRGARVVTRRKLPPRRTNP